MTLRPRKHGTGFSLVELMTAMLLAGMVATGSVRIAAAASASYRLQQNLGALQENARFAFHAMHRELAQAGYTPAPWDAAMQVAAITADSADSAAGDRLGVARWSRRNCFENPNPVRDGEGQPAYHLRESTFHINGSGSLALRCRYGPDHASLVTQVNNQGLVNDARSLQLLYAEDSDGDGNADRWLRAGEWAGEADITAVRIGLLLATPEATGSISPVQWQLLDETVSAPADGRMYRAFETVAALEGRLR